MFPILNSEDFLLVTVLMAISTALSLRPPLTLLLSQMFTNPSSAQLANTDSLVGHHWTDKQREEKGRDGKQVRRQKVQQKVQQKALKPRV